LRGKCCTCRPTREPATARTALRASHVIRGTCGARLSPRGGALDRVCPSPKARRTRRGPWRGGPSEGAPG